MIGLTDTLRQSASAEDKLFEQIFMHLDLVTGPDEVGYRLCESRRIPDSYPPMSIPIDR